MESLPPLTADVIALTEKKMDMTLDDIIKMSKKSKQKTRNQSVSNKSQQPFSNKLGARDVAAKARVQQSVSRSSALRQGKLAEMRSRNANNQFPVVKETARRVAAGRSVQWNKRRIGPSFSVRNNRLLPVVSATRATQFNGSVKQRPQTLDSLFANMKEQRLRAQAQAVGRQTNFGNKQRYWEQTQTFGRQTNFGNKQRNWEQSQTFGRQTNFGTKQRSFGGRQRNFVGWRKILAGHQRGHWLEEP